MFILMSLIKFNLVKHDKTTTSAAVNSSHCNTVHLLTQRREEEQGSKETREQRGKFTVKHVKIKKKKGIIFEFKYQDGTIGASCIL